jgi:hypothetical protein
MEQGDIDELCRAISDCFESIDDLILKIWFRRRFLRGNRRAPALSYEQAVHGWQNPPFDVGRLRIFPTKRSRRAGRPRRPQPGERRTDERERVLEKPDALPVGAEGPASPAEETVSGTVFPSSLAGAGSGV